MTLKEKTVIVGLIVLGILCTIILGFTATRAIEAERARVEAERIRTDKTENALNAITNGWYKKAPQEEAQMIEQLKSMYQQPSQTSQPATQP